MAGSPAQLIYGLAEDASTAAVAEFTAVEEIRHKDLVAIVREVADGRDERQGDEGLSQEQLQHWLMDHQRTTIALFQHRTILPLRFGTMADSKKAVQDFLAASYLQVKSALVRMRGKGEFAVQLFWDLPVVLQEIGREELVLDGLGDSADRVTIGRRLFESAERKKQRLVETVHRQLAKVSLES